ncbi:ABC transporter substrate-binding protein [Marinobacter salarius]|uniref:ABC transporter substrate-binding protein n=1 Tax=Marinobacter TaxID=2742 RepID=UPI001D1821BC|nr:ABC transporter substrate-binding protein [Marinobacter salarius]MCC4284154.1 ABC transporter substrate-binding protein [Marinobacter salarius]MDP4534408.1 ABC transporter substrate-binding protein [Marinobacter salarius]
MTLIKRMALAATIGATLALPATAIASNASPGVISFNHGSLDTLEALDLGDHVLAVPKQSLPGYLSKYASDDYPDAGGLKSPDLEVIGNLKPDLVLITGRQGDMLDDVAEGIEVVNVGLPESDFAEGVNTRVLELAARFNATNRAEKALDGLWHYAETQKQTIEGSPQVLVITHNDGKYGLRHEPVVADLLGLSSPEIPEGTETFTRGPRTFTPLTPEVIAAMAPDAVLVVDRSASIGQPGLEKATLVGQLEAAGMDKPDVTILSPGLWYLSGGGLQSIRLQIEEVIQALR